MSKKSYSHKVFHHVFNLCANTIFELMPCLFCKCRRNTRIFNGIFYFSSAQFKFGRNFFNVHVICYPPRKLSFSSLNHTHIFCQQYQNPPISNQHHKRCQYNQKCEIKYRKYANIISAFTRIVLYIFPESY